MSETVRMLEGGDVRRMERMLKTTAKLLDMMDDAIMRGLIEDFNARTRGGRGLRADLAEFHDWNAGRVAFNKGRRP